MSITTIILGMQGGEYPEYDESGAVVTIGEDPGWSCEFTAGAAVLTSEIGSIVIAESIVAALRGFPCGRCYGLGFMLTDGHVSQPPWGSAHAFRDFPKRERCARCDGTGRVDMREGE